MTEPYDPYRPNPNDVYGKPGGQYGQPQYGQPQQPGQPQYGQPQYGQPQYGQPPYGQQYQGSYGQPAGWGTAGPPQPPQPQPQPPRRRSSTPLVVTAVLLLLIGGGVAAAVAVRDGGAPGAQPAGTNSSRPSTGPSPTTSESEDFEVGQCGTLTPQGSGWAKVRLTECGGLLSDVVIAKIESSECPEPYLSFNPGVGKFYCLAMDAREGDCFRLDNLIKRAIACAGGETRKVIKIFDGVADDSTCGTVPETVAVYAYPDPPKTLCLGRA